MIKKPRQWRLSRKGKNKLSKNIAVRSDNFGCG